MPHPTRKRRLDPPCSGCPRISRDGKRFAYASKRPYGHRLTAATSQCSLVQGQKQCKQLWITAIDRDKLANGSDDPSSAPFWIPGQATTDQYVSPQWTKAVLPPPE